MQTTTVSTRGSGGAAKRKAGVRVPPGPVGTIAGIARYFDILRDPLGTLLQAHARYGDVMRMQIGPQFYWLVSDPDAVRHVLVENAKNYVKSPNYVGLKLVLGQGLVTSDGELWKRQRRLASPAFSPKKIDGFVPVFTDAVEAMLDEWERAGSAEIDAHVAMSKLTLSVVGRCLFDVDLGAQATEGHAKAFHTVLHFSNAYAFAPVKLPIGTPLPSFNAFRSALGELDALVEGIIRDRRARVARGESAGNDLLATFLSATDESGAAMDDRQLRDEVMTMVGAGHETTANALSFTLRLLSQHPDVERRVHDEVRKVCGDRPIRAEDVPALGFTHRTIMEAMRILPPVWMIERMNVEDDEIAGYHVPKGTVIGVSPWVLHRDPRWFENPEGFDPDRWLPERQEGGGRPRWVYMPFGAGPRICIGNGFAMTEATVLLAAIVRRARLELVPGRSMKLDPNVTLRPKHGLFMRVRPRKAACAAAGRTSPLPALGATPTSAVHGPDAPVASVPDPALVARAAAGCPHAAAMLAEGKG